MKIRTPSGDDDTECDLFLDHGSFQDAIDQAEEPVTHISTPSSRKDKGTRNAWYGGATWEEALDLARTGWTEGRERVISKARSMNKAAGREDFRPTPVPSRVGTEPDINRYNAGDREHMITWEQEQTPGSGKIIAIGYNMATSAGIDAETMFNRGAAILNLVDQLETRNKRVHLDLVESGSHSRGKSMSNRINLKKPNQPLETDRLAFALCHASMLRRIMFSIWEQQSEEHSWLRIPGSYGSPSDVCPMLQDQYDVYLSRSHLRDINWDNQDVVDEWVDSQLEEQGVALDG